MNTSVSSRSNAPAAVPLHCLSQYMIIRKLSSGSAARVSMSILGLSFHLNRNLAIILVMVHFLPILVDSVVPCGIPTNVPESPVGLAPVTVTFCPAAPTVVSFRI